MAKHFESEKRRSCGASSLLPFTQTKASLATNSHKTKRPMLMPHTMHHTKSFIILKREEKKP